MSRLFLRTAEFLHPLNEQSQKISVDHAIETNASAGTTYVTALTLDEMNMVGGGGPPAAGDDVEG